MNIKDLNDAVVILDRATLALCKESMAVYLIADHASKHINRQLEAMIREGAA